MGLINILYLRIQWALAFPSDLNKFAPVNVQVPFVNSSKLAGTFTWPSCRSTTFLVYSGVYSSFLLWLKWFWPVPLPLGTGHSINLVTFQHTPWPTASSGPLCNFTFCSCAFSSQLKTMFEIFSLKGIIWEPSLLALIIAIIRSIRVLLEYIDRKVRKYSDTCCSRTMMCLCKCCFWYS